MEIDPAEIEKIFALQNEHWVDTLALEISKRISKVYNVDDPKIIALIQLGAADGIKVCQGITDNKKSVKPQN